jgi:hypothetical protein
MRVDPGTTLGGYPASRRPTPILQSRHMNILTKRGRLSLTAWMRFCRGPRYRSVVCTKAWPRRSWICSRSPSETRQSFGIAAQVVRRETGFPEPLSVRPDHVPNPVLADAALQNSSGLVQRRENGTGTDSCPVEPLVDDHLLPMLANRPQAIPLPRQVRQHSPRIPRMY